MTSVDFYKDIDNHLQIKAVLEQFEIEYENENDVEFFDELMSGILEEYPTVQNLKVVLDRILVHIVNKYLHI